MNYVAFSGGKDSTALVMRLRELGEPFECIFTPTGNELPELLDHITTVESNLGLTIHRPPAPTLFELIDGYNALPNWRQRWCTRQIKIEPCIAFLKGRPGSTLSVGLRADEEARIGLYGDWATYRYPLREWGWGIEEVWAYLKEKGVTVPARTDCALCYGQRLSEWFRLWRDHPDEYAKGEELEAKAGHTFRSPGRDKWPAALSDLRARFEAGYIPKGTKTLDLFAEDCERFEPGTQPCRVCRI